MSETKSYEVISDFIDEETGKVVKAGSSVDVNDYRAAQLYKARVIKYVGSIQTTTPMDQTKVDAGQKDDHEPEKYPKHTGGGYYELSNGEKVQGKENAVEKQLELDDAADGGGNLAGKPEKD